MFPLVHFFVNSKIVKKSSDLLALGGLFPDLAAGAGFDRDQAHMMGDDFFAWCSKHHPQALDLARGIIAHGISPHAVDYYADEYWPNYHKGWCFMIGEKYMPPVAAATHLPANLIWWKAHNFVEMACELITETKNPRLKLGLLQAITNQDAKQKTSAVLSFYSGKNTELIEQVFTKVPEIFALHDISAKTLAEKQALAFSLRHGVDDADIPAMAALIEQISSEIEPLYDTFLQKIINETALVLADY